MVQIHCLFANLASSQVHFLNRHANFGLKADNAKDRVQDIFDRGPGGSTDVNNARGHTPARTHTQTHTHNHTHDTKMTNAVLRALKEHERERSGQSLFLLIVTDGEANDMTTFRNLLDGIQNGKYGDVQVCLVGLSLVEKDIEWFEDEECDDTRIRTIEAFEVEQTHESIP